jgi:2-dehydropantoate 2-reductase
MKKVLIVGCGAIGSLFAAHLAQSGEVEVYAFDASQAHVDAINRNGLRLSGAADVHVKLARASSDPAELPVCDYGIVATKAIHTAQAIRAAARCFDSNSAVCSVQNGAGNEEIIAEHVKYVIRGTTFPAGHLVEPGHVGFDIKGDTWIGPFEPSKVQMERVEQLAGFLTCAGMNTIAMPDARGAQWTKLIFNAATNPVGALTGLHHGAASRFPPTAELFEALIQEGEAVAKALGIELHGDPRELVAKGANAPGRHRASMLQDVLAQRATEVDFMNGAIVKWGEKYGMPTPLNHAMWELIKGLEQSWTEL